MRDYLRSALANTRTSGRGLYTAALVALILVLTLPSGCFIGDHTPKVFLRNNSDHPIAISIPFTTPKGISSPIEAHSEAEAFEGINGLGDIQVQVLEPRTKKLLVVEMLTSEDITDRMQDGNLHLEYPLKGAVQTKPDAVRR